MRLQTFQSTETVEYMTEQCCNCAVFFAIPMYLYQRRKEDKGYFYCPNGHSQYYTKSEADRLREKLDEQTRIATREAERAVNAEQELKRVSRRVNNGVCPCCHRTFKQLAQHMKSKHPEMVMSRKPGKRKPKRD